MNRSLITCICLFVFLGQLNSQDINPGVKRKMPFQISLITPIGTNGVNAHRIENKVSINLIAGLNGGLDGFECGGVLRPRASCSRTDN